MKGKLVMKNKHEQLHVAVQDLLIELGITPRKLRGVATNETHGYIKPVITQKTAQKLIDADLIVEQINWRKPVMEPGKLIVSNKNNEVSEIDASQPKEDHLHKKTTSAFDKIKSGLAPGILWSYLQEKHPDFLYKQIKDYLFPGC